jgi:hypothetical protein
MQKKLKVEFAPGCFDSFTGTQEELDELVSEIQKMVETGELFEKSNAVDIDTLIEEDPEMAEVLIKQLSTDSDESRKLQ